MPLQAKGFYSYNICSPHWFAALLCEVARAVARFLRRALAKTCLQEFFRMKLGIKP